MSNSCVHMLNTSPTCGETGNERRKGAAEAKMGSEGRLGD